MRSRIAAGSLHVTACLAAAVAVGAALALGQGSQRVGAPPRGPALVATGQALRPAGRSVTFEGRPIDMALAPNGRWLYVKDNRGLVVIDTAAWKVKQEVKVGGASAHGIAVSPDGGHVYFTDHLSGLRVCTVAPDGKVSEPRRIALPERQGGGASYPCGVALTADGGTALVALSLRNTLAVVDVRAGTVLREAPVGVGPYAVALTRDGSTALVTNFGGRRPRAAEVTAPSGGTPTLIDDRGVARSGSLSFVDVRSGAELAQVDTGLHPCDIALSPDGTRAYVANSNSDTVTVVDVAGRKALDTLWVRPDPALPFGSQPTSVAVSPDGRTLYTANGGNNAVAVLSPQGALRGLIPAGWYPGAVLVDGRRLYVANVKGVGSRSRASDGKAPAREGYSVYQYRGTVTRVELPADRRLAAWTAQARADARVPQALLARERSERRGRPVPVPARQGEPSVFEHVVYVIKENRTYDQVFGDLPQGDGDPSLCTFPREVSPNHHALAEQFVLLDNFYCNGVLSADGHSWATEGSVSDNLEKAFGGFSRSYTFGDDPLTYASTGFIWDNVLAHGLSFRNYGEMDYAEPVPAGRFTDIYRDFVNNTGRYTFRQKVGIDNLRRFTAPDCPGWNMEIPDVLRADRFLKDLARFERDGGLPNLVIVYLPQDHTSGAAPGAPTPRAHVADNDLALGRIVEGLSKSRFWPKTCIFVVEDDPQNGYDHVDGHRSICLVASPYTRRGAVVSRFYNQTSVLHTMARILGVPPLNQMDAAAPLMTACFTGRPELRPYKALPARVPLDELNPPAAALRGQAREYALLSAGVRLDGPDRIDVRAFSRAVWHAVRGDARYPAEWEGAHGRGLAAKGLRLAE